MGWGGGLQYGAAMLVGLFKTLLQVSTKS